MTELGRIYDKLNGIDVKIDNLGEKHNATHTHVSLLESRLTNIEEKVDKNEENNGKNWSKVLDFVVKVAGTAALGYLGVSKAAASFF